MSYTPTMDELREAWLSVEFEERDASTSDDDLRAEFDRAIAAHDAEVRAQTLNNAADTFEWAGDDEDYTAFREWLRNRAGEQR